MRFPLLPSRTLTVLTLAMLLAWPASSQAPAPIPEGTPNGFVVQRGTNISHWLSQSRRRGEERKRFFTEEDVTLIARLGYDHVRLPVDEEQLWDDGGAARGGGVRPPRLGPRLVRGPGPAGRSSISTSCAPTTSTRGRSRCGRTRGSRIASSTSGVSSPNGSPTARSTSSPTSC